MFTLNVFKSEYSIIGHKQLGISPISWKEDSIKTINALTVNFNPVPKFENKTSFIIFGKKPTWMTF